MDLERTRKLYLDATKLADGIAVLQKDCADSHVRGNLRIAHTHTLRAITRLERAVRFLLVYGPPGGDK